MTVLTGNQPEENKGSKGRDERGARLMDVADDVIENANE